MKRIFTIAAAALLSSAFTTTSFAGWGENGQYGNPVGPVVGPSSTPSTNPASAPINVPFDPNGDLGSVPGSIQDKVSKLPPGGTYGQLGGYNPNNPMYKPGMPSGPNMPSNPGMPSSTGGFFPQTQMPQSPSTQSYPMPMNNYPQYPQQYPQQQTQSYPQQYPQYPTQMSSGYPQPSGFPQGYPQANNYPTNSYPTNSYPTNSYPPSYPQSYPQTSGYPKPMSYPKVNSYPATNSYPSYPQRLPTTGTWGMPTSSWGGYGGSSSASHGVLPCGHRY